MTTIRHILVFSVAAAAVAFAGCGEGEVSAASARRLCEAGCEKSTTCFSSPIPIDCEAQCSQSVGGEPGTSDCHVSSSEVDKCAADLKAQSCDDVKAGKTPSSCDFCPSNNTPDASGDTSTTFPDSSSATATCADLLACCAKIADSGMRLGCEQTVGLASDATCSTVLAGYKAAGSCD